MSQEPFMWEPSPSKRCTFEQWLKSLFDHPADNMDVYHDAVDKSYWCDNSARRHIAFVTEAFENAEDVLGMYSNAQLNQGLWHLMGHGTEYLFSLLNRRVTWAARERCLRSIIVLFEQIFVRRCSPGLGHLSEAQDNHLNGICYMWWDLDVLPFYPLEDPIRRRINEFCLDIMATILSMDSMACQESALHGLGHEHLYHPQYVETTIDAFLIRNPNIRPELAAYARRAKFGRVM